MKRARWTRWMLVAVMSGAACSAVPTPASVPTAGRPAAAEATHGPAYRPDETGPVPSGAAPILSTLAGSAALERQQFCPPLSPPAGPTVRVATESALRDRAANAPEGTTVLVASGIYAMQDFVHVVHPGVALRGETGNRDDVVLDFGGMESGHFGILVEADDVTIADLTVRNAHDHGVSIQGVDRPVLYNLHILDTRDQLVKVNPAGDGSEDGLLACSRLEYTTSAPDDYTNGISAHDAHRWVVRDNLWVRIRTLDGNPVPTILFWSGSSDTVVERNRLVDCSQGIAFGNASHGSGDHLGGVVRNNTIYASLPHDVAIEMVHAAGWLVAHNTALLLEPGPGLTWGMEARFPDSQGTFAYNLTNMALWLDRDGAQGEGVGNLTGAQPGWFLDPAAGDLHLQPDAAAAIDQAAALPEVTDDLDGDPRPLGAAPDVGADEVNPAGPTGDERSYLPLIQASPAPPRAGLIQPEELLYLGAFRLPADLEGMGWEWSGESLTYYPEGDPAGMATMAAAVRDAELARLSNPQQRPAMTVGAREVADGMGGRWPLHRLLIGGGYLRDNEIGPDEGLFDLTLDYERVARITSMRYDGEQNRMALTLNENLQLDSVLARFGYEWRLADQLQRELQPVV